jgi:hypothetical protein
MTDSQKGVRRSGVKPQHSSEFQAEPAHALVTRTTRARRNLRRVKCERLLQRDEISFLNSKDERIRRCVPFLGTVFTSLYGQEDLCCFRR